MEVWSRGRRERLGRGVGIWSEPNDGYSGRGFLAPKAAIEPEARIFLVRRKRLRRGFRTYEQTTTFLRRAEAEKLRQDSKTVAEL
jgi:hypothetical protein